MNWPPETIVTASIELWQIEHDCICFSPLFTYARWRMSLRQWSIRHRVARPLLHSNDSVGLLRTCSLAGPSTAV